MAETNEVKAVGFAFMSPEVVLLVSDKSTHCLHFYPAKTEGARNLDLSDQTKPHWVLLKSPEHLGAIARYADSISRLIVFGRGEELLGLGLPILDGTVNETTITAQRRNNRDELLARIDTEAVPLALENPGKLYETMKDKEQEQAKMDTTPSGRTFFQQLKELKTIVGKDNPKLNIVTQVGIPAIKRLMGDVDREAFMQVCKLLVTHGGVDDNRARAFYRWIEGFDGEGVELGKAVDALLYPTQKSAETIRGESAWTEQLTEEIAVKFGVSEADLLFVARSYAQLQGAEPEAPPAPDPVEDGFPEDVESPDADVDYGAPEEDEAYVEPTTDLPEDPFGWPDENDGDGSVFGDADGFHEADPEQEADENASVFDDGDFSDFAQ